MGINQPMYINNFYVVEYSIKENALRIETIVDLCLKNQLLATRGEQPSWFMIGLFPEQKEARKFMNEQKEKFQSKYTPSEKTVEYLKVYRERQMDSLRHLGIDADNQCFERSVSEALELATELMKQMKVIEKDYALIMSENARLLSLLDNVKSEDVIGKNEVIY